MRNPRKFNINLPRVMGDSYTPVQAALDRLYWRRSHRNDLSYYGIRQLGTGPHVSIDQSWRTVDESLAGIKSEWFDDIQGFTPGIGIPPRSLESVTADMLYRYRGDRAESAFLDYGTHIPGFALGEEGAKNLNLWKKKAIKFRAENYFSQISMESYGSSFSDKALRIAQGKGGRKGKYYDILENPDNPARIKVGETPGEELKKLQRDNLTHAKIEAHRAAEKVEAVIAPDTVFIPGEEAAFHTKEEIADYAARINSSELSTSEKAQWIEDYKNEGQRAVIQEKARSADSGVTTAEGDLISKYRVSQKTRARLIAGSEHETLSHGRPGDFGIPIDRPSAGGSTLFDREYNWAATAFDQSTTFYNLEQGKNFYSFGEADLTGLKISLQDKVLKSQANELLGLSGTVLEERAAGAKKFLSHFDAFEEVARQLEPRTTKKGLQLLGGELEDLNIFPERIAIMKGLSKKLQAASKIKDKTTRLLQTQSVLNEISYSVIEPIRGKVAEALKWPGGKMVEGYGGLKELLATADAGTIFTAAQGGRTGNVVVDYLQDSGGMDILLNPDPRAGIAAGTVVKKRVLDAAYDRKRLAKFEKAGYRDPVALYGIKTPMIIGKKKYLNAIGLYFPGGDFAGYVSNTIAERYSKKGGIFADIKSGYVGEFSADILDSGKGAKLSRLAFDEEGKAFREQLGNVKGIIARKKGKLLLVPDVKLEYDSVTKSFKEVSGLPIQDTWKRAWRGEKALITADETSRMVAEAFARPIGGAEARVVDAAARASKLTEKTGGKGVMAGLAIAAGALILYGASRLAKSNKPITSGDVPRSLYGDVGARGPGPGRVYTPQARIMQNNNGYSTNIDVEATDSNNTVDYRALAGALSSMSGTSLGVGRVNTSLHVVDDSRRMDKESVKRAVNQQLSL